MADFNQIEYQNKYNKENYDRILLVLPAGYKEQLKEIATEQSKSVNKLIKEAIDNIME